MPWVYITWAQWRNRLADDYDYRKEKNPRVLLGWEYADYVMRCIWAPIGCTYLVRPERKELPLHIKFHRGYVNSIWDGFTYKEGHES